MSIILKGIDIPEKENRMYMMELYADGHCSVAKIEDGECYELTIPSETEAIQIPKDHGKLIDGDAFIRTLQSMFCTNCEEHEEYGGVVCGKCFITDTVLAYGDFPTILEVEGEG